LIAQIQVGQMSYYLVDGLGSTRFLTDGLGQVLNSYGYEAFGETTSQSGTASNKYQFAGEQFDSALGDYYLRQRFYDTSSGRFGRMDTYEGGLLEPFTLHKYLYTHSNPIGGTDSTGFFNLNGLLAALNIQKILAYTSIIGVGSGLFFTQTNQGQSLAGIRGRSKESYDTMDAAGIAAIREINPTSISEGKEYGGIIAKSFFDGKYFYTKAKRGNGATIS
jgi:RHS repeat-associated protein